MFAARFTVQLAGYPVGVRWSERPIAYDSTKSQERKLALPPVVGVTNLVQTSLVFAVCVTLERRTA